MLSDQLRARISELGWNIETTAQRTELHRQMITKLLSGETRDPRLSTLKRLSRGLRMSIDELVENTGLALNQDRPRD